MLLTNSAKSFNFCVEDIPNLWEIAAKRRPLLGQIVA